MRFDSSKEAGQELPKPADSLFCCHQDQTGPIDDDVIPSTGNCPSAILRQGRGRLQYQVVLVSGQELAFKGVALQPPDFDVPAQIIQWIVNFLLYHGVGKKTPAFRPWDELPLYDHHKLKCGNTALAGRIS